MSLSFSLSLYFFQFPIASNAIFCMLKLKGTISRGGVNRLCHNALVYCRGKTKSCKTKKIFMNIRYLQFYVKVVSDTVYICTYTKRRMTKLVKVSGELIP
jgi:hypothetical protein